MYVSMYNVEDVVYTIQGDSGLNRVLNIFGTNEYLEFDYVVYYIHSLIFSVNNDI